MDDSLDNRWLLVDVIEYKPPKARPRGRDPIDRAWQRGFWNAIKSRPLLVAVEKARRGRV